MPEKKTSTTGYPLIGRLALKHQLIEPQDLELSIAACAGAQSIEQAMIEYLVSRELVSLRDMKRLINISNAMKIRNKDIKFGSIAVRKNFLSKSMLEMALDEQKQELNETKQARLLGDILIEAGMLTLRQRDEILKEQNRLQEIAEPIPKPVLATTEKPAAEPSEKEIPARTSEQKSFKGLTASGVDAIVIEGGMTLMIPEDAYAAYLNKTDDFDDMISADTIKEVLSHHHIVYGIVDDSLINGFIRSKGFKEKSFRIAQGIEPVPGKNSVIHYLFDTDPVKVGQITEEGAIDFREREAIPQVEAGTILAEKEPAIDKVDGRTVYGDIIPAPLPQDPPLKHDKGTTLSEDGLKIIAAIMGQPKLSWSGSVSVVDEFVTKCDVDYETGNIYYPGNIKVNGCILNGFKVKGNIIKAEEIDGGIIHAEGDLVVTGGINEAKIYSKGNVWAKFIHKSEILCMGDVNIIKEIVDATIENSGACMIQTGKIISSNIAAKMGIYARDVGTELSGPSFLKTGLDPYMTKELERVRLEILTRKNRLAKTAKLITKFKEANRQNQENTTKLAHIQDRTQLEHQDLLSQITSLNEVKQADEILALNQKLTHLKSDAEAAETGLNKLFDMMDRIEIRIKRLEDSLTRQKQQLDDLLQEKETVQKLMNELPGVSLIEVKGSISAGTRVSGKHSETVLDQTVKNSRIKELMFTHPGEDRQKGFWEMRVVSI